LSKLSNTTTGSWAELLRGANGWRSLAVTGGVALHALNVYIATTIMPSVVEDIEGLAYYAWNTSLFLVASILGAVLVSRLLARPGPRDAYLLALLVFSLGSAVCALAPTMPWMLVGRTVQGLGGGMLLSLSYGLVRIMFEEALWARAMALISGMWGFSTLAGPAVGGIFAEFGSWRIAFWVLLPAAAGLAAIVIRHFPRDDQSAAPASDTRTPRLQLSLLVLSVLAISIASLQDKGYLQALGLIIGLLIGVAMASLDNRSQTRLLPTGAYSLDSRIGATFATMLLLIFGMSTEIFVPYFLQIVHGLSPLPAGYFTAVMSAGWTTAALLGSTQDERGSDRMIRTGPGIMAASLLALALLMPKQGHFDSIVGAVLVTLPLFGAGFGIGMGWPHLLTRVLNLARPGEENLTSSSITVVQLYSLAVGTSLAGLVANAAGLTSPGGLAGAQQAAIWLFAIFALLSGLGLLSARRSGRRDES